jgi:hypothetical protein
MERGSVHCYTFIMKKILLLRDPLKSAALIFLLIAAVGISVQYTWEREVLVKMSYDDVITKYGYDTEAEIGRYTEALKDAYRADTYGGATPEETLMLFKSALEKGDTDLAAKYFLLEKQNVMAEDLGAALDNGVLELLIFDLNRVSRGAPLTDERYRFYALSDAGQEFSFDLIINPYNGIWKIESL